MSTPAGLVDHALRMFNAHANRKRFGLQGHAALVQHDKGVARAVAQGQHHMACGQGVTVASFLVQHLQARELVSVLSGGEQQIGHTLFKADLATQSGDLFADVLHHLDQLEGANVRVRCKQDVGWGPRFDEFIHHFAAQMARVFDLAVELAVTECACAAFAKLHIALWVQLLLAPQAPGVFGALAHRFATLQHDGFEAHLRQTQRGKHAARPKTHHHRAFPLVLAKVGRRVAGRVPGHVRGGLNVRVLVKLLQHSRFVLCMAQRDVDDEHGQQLGLARVKAALEHVQRSDVADVNVQGLGGQLPQSGFGVRGRDAVFVGFSGGIGGATNLDRQGRQREFEFRNSDHGRGLWLSSKKP